MPDQATILFVDDDIRFQDAMRRSLRRLNKAWALEFTSSAYEALDRLQCARVDVVVLDLGLPGVDGFAMLESLRAAEATRNLPVIILTGNQQDDLKRRALDLGATDLLTKPVPLEDLIARLQSALRLRAYQEELQELNRGLEDRVRRRTAELEQACLDIIWRLAKAGEFRDEETGNHVARIGCYCQALAEGLGLPATVTQTLFVAAPLHDIGKIGVPGEILLKRGTLSPQERKVVERHCEIGEEILRSQPRSMQLLLEWKAAGASPTESVIHHATLDMAASIALGHHERWDGRGYPRGLTGEATPLEARIMAVADAYDALGSSRPHRRAFPPDTAMQMIRSEAGQRFDPSLMWALERAIDEFQEIQVHFGDPEGAEVVTGAAQT